MKNREDEPKSKPKKKNLGKTEKLQRSNEQNETTEYITINITDFKN